MPFASLASWLERKDACLLEFGVREHYCNLPVESDWINSCKFQLRCEETKGHETFSTCCQGGGQWGCNDKLLRDSKDCERTVINDLTDN